MQNVSLIGRVGKDPVLRHTPDGVAVTSVSLATTRTVSKRTYSGDRPCPRGWKESYNGKNWEITTWWTLTFWRNNAQTIKQYVSKGDKLWVSGVVSGEASDGTLNPRVWTGNDGQARASFELDVQEFELLGGNGGSGDKEEGDDGPLPF